MIEVTFSIKGDVEDFSVLARLYDVLKRESQRILKETRITVRTEEREEVEVEGTERV